MAASATIKRRPAGLRRLWQIQSLRLLVQLGFALLILYTLVIHTLVGEGSGVVTTSAEAYCPFGGIETLYTYLSSGGRLVSHTHLSNLVILAGVLLLAVAARGAFCGWICPLGAIQEWLFAASMWLQRRIPSLGRAVKALKARAGVRPIARFDQRLAPTLLARIDHWLRYGRYLVLAWAVGGAAIYGYMVFRDYDPWAALLTIGELELSGGLVVLGVVLVAALFVERPWCRYACPLGAAIGIASKVSPLRLRRAGPACAGCALCNRDCPVGIPVDTRSDITDASCIMCLRCVDTCPKHGALELALVIPVVSPRPSGAEQ
ncbi:MAG: 4Fe-4S binding protein [Kouleothrix sp.]|nr:4Fe-4S binding protein [Kouleothrix sp.]